MTTSKKVQRPFCAPETLVFVCRTSPSGLKQRLMNRRKTLILSFLKLGCKCNESNDKGGKFEMKAYILALDGEPRNHELIPTLKSAGVNVCIISGTTVESAKEHLRGISILRRERNQLNDFERACAYGHLKMQREAFSQGEDWNLFLEDDAVLDKESFENLISKLSELPKGLTLLGVCGGLAYKKPFNRELNLFRLVENMFNGSHAYIADRDSIGEVIKTSWNLPDYADRFPRPRKVKMFVLFPFVALQMKENVPIISREDGMDSRGRLRKTLSLFFYDIKDFRESHFLSGRTLGYLTSQSKSRKYFLRLPGCRD